MNKYPPLPALAELHPAGFNSAGVTRRSFLIYSAAGLVSISLIPASESFAALPVSNVEEENEFNRLCRFLTGKDLSLSLTKRSFSALSHVDTDFEQRARELSAFIRRGHYASIEALKVDSKFDDHLRQTALSIISSLYLGYAGTARPDHSEDNTQFVTYTEALMYRLTYDYTPIPSYSRWSTGYWTSVPK